MFGHIPLVFKSYIVRCHGEHKWKEILNKCGCKDDFEDENLTSDAFLDKIVPVAENILKQLVKADWTACRQSQKRKINIGVVYVIMINTNMNGQRALNIPIVNATGMLLESALKARQVEPMQNLQQIFQILQVQLLPGDEDKKCLNCLPGFEIALIETKRNDFLVLVGEEYLHHLQSTGHNQLLRLLGSTFYQFVQNIDFVHSIALSRYPNANMPSFRCDAISAENQILLHYYSKHKHLGKLVEGLLSAVAKTYFTKKLDIKIDEEYDEKVGPDKIHHRHHVVYGIQVKDIPRVAEAPPTLIAQTRKHGEIQIKEEDVEEQKSKIDQIRLEQGEDALPVNKARKAKAMWKAAIRVNMLYQRMNPTIPRTLSVSPQAFCEVFPYHFVFDEDMNLKQAGVQIQQIIPSFRIENENITKHLELLHPSSCKFTYENVLKFIDCPHVLKTKVNRLSKAYSQKNAMLLRGQMMWLSDKKLVLYMCSPYVTNLTDLEERGIHVSDIPTHDVTKYLLYSDVCHGDIWMRSYTGKGDGKAKGALLGSRGKDDGRGDSSKNGGVMMLVNGQNYDTNGIDGGDWSNSSHGIGTLSLLPPGIAEKMRSGAKVEGKVYKPVSILFCDIVHFNKMVEECKPSDAVEMLGNLHREFDRLTRVHDVFRVELIGDAYMVCSGIPDKVKTHADRVINMGLAMLIVSRGIWSPIDFGGDIGKRALIRVGAHTGEVVAGVIGATLPRFTVMGEAVVTASRLESHGIPDQFHISPAIYKELRAQSYDIKERGSIGIRGLGRMYTYIVKSNKDVTIETLIGRSRRPDDVIVDFNTGSSRPSSNNKVSPSRPSSSNNEVVPFPYKD